METAEQIVQGAEGAPPEPETPAPETTSQTQPEPTTEAPQEGLAPELQEQLDSRFGALRSELGLELPAFDPGQAPEEPEQPDQPEFGYQNQVGDEFSDVDEETQQRIEAYLDQKIEQATGRRLEPFFEGEMRRQRVEAGLALEEQYPELKNKQVAEPVFNLGKGLLEEMGAPQLVNHPTFPKFLQLIYLASKADAAASSETPAGQEGHEVTLEQPGARAPSAGQEELTEQQRIVGADGPGLFR